MDDHGEFGYMTTAQWRAFQWAVSYSFTLVPWLYAAGNYSISVDVGVGSNAVDPPLGIPATRIAAIEIERLSKQLGEWNNLEDIANDIFGVEIANLFTREVQTADARWPIAEEPHDVEEVRCKHCGLLALVYAPPEKPGDDTVIRCEECGEEESDQDFASRLTQVREEMELFKRAS